MLKPGLTGRFQAVCYAVPIDRLKRKMPGEPCTTQFAVFGSVSLPPAPLLLILLSSAVRAFAAHAQLDPQTRKLAHDIFQQLIEINTTDSVGSITAAAEAMQQRLLDAGFPDRTTCTCAARTTARRIWSCAMHGTGAKKPILFIGHLDVVEARREDWTTDPFQFVEKDGYYYGRGTQDMKERRRHPRHHLHPPEAGRLQARPRPHPRAHRR